jgi:hypothetical protein
LHLPRLPRPPRLAQIIRQQSPGSHLHPPPFGCAAQQQADDASNRPQRPLEMFFPFDPYLLRRSSACLELQGSYRRWRHGSPVTAEQAGHPAGAPPPRPARLPGGGGGEGACAAVPLPQPGPSHDQAAEVARPSWHLFHPHPCAGGSSDDVASSSSSGSEASDSEESSSDTSEARDVAGASLESGGHMALGGTSLGASLPPLVHSIARRGAKGGSVARWGRAGGGGGGGACGLGQRRGGLRSP